MSKKLSEQIENIIISSIRPQLQMHGGDIRILSIEDKNIRIQLLGNCRSCPSAQITTEDIVEKKIKEVLGDRINKVILVNETSDDLLNFAKKLLQK